MTSQIFSCLFTKHKTKKHKIWEDGRFVINSNKKGLLYPQSQTSSPLDSIFLQSTFIEPGKRLELDQHLVEITEEENTGLISTSSQIQTFSQSFRSNHSKGPHSAPLSSQTSDALSQIQPSSDHNKNHQLLFQSSKNQTKPRMDSLVQPKQLSFRSLVTEEKKTAREPPDDAIEFDQIPQQYPQTKRFGIQKALSAVNTLFSDELFDEECPKETHLGLPPSTAHSSLGFNPSQQYPNHFDQDFHNRSLDTKHTTSRRESAKGPSSRLGKRHFNAPEPHFLSGSEKLVIDDLKSGRCNRSLQSTPSVNQMESKDTPGHNLGSGALLPYRPPYGGSRRGGTTGKPKEKNAQAQQEELDEMLITNIVDSSPGVSWDDIAGLNQAKEALLEFIILPSLRPDIFTGIRSPPRGVLLFGPPGNGKTMIAKAVATESRSTFFSISASSLTSKWIGEGEKMVKGLFRLAKERAPSVIFIDEVDSILSERTSTEHDSMRRLKTEFLCMFDGVTSYVGSERILVIGATNRPYDLDDAVRRRFTQRIYIQLPDIETRKQLISHLIQTVRSDLDPGQIDEVAALTADYSSSDLAALTKDASMGPIRELGSKIKEVDLSDVRPVCVSDFKAGIKRIRPSVNLTQLQTYVKWNAEYGTAAMNSGQSALD